VLIRWLIDQRVLGEWDHFVPVHSRGSLKHNLSHPCYSSERIVSQESEPVLSRLLSPVDVNVFFKQYWERKPLHISRADDQRFADLASADAIEQLLSTQDLHFPTVQLTGGDSSVAAADYTDSENRIVPMRLLQHHRQGSTLVLTRAHRFLAPVGRVCRQLSADLQWRCQGNLYLSPPGQQGFNAHYDTHDVIVLQISGRKTFRFYSRGAELPFPQSQFDPTGFDPGDVRDEMMLEPGDTLYIPRGMTHAAVADRAQSSMHLTVGVFPMTVRDLLQETIEVAAADDVALRHSLDTTVWRGDLAQADSLSSLLSTSLQGVVPTIFTEKNLAAALSQLRDEEAIEGQQSCYGLLNAPDFSDAELLEREVLVNASSLQSLERVAHALIIRISGQVLEFPAPMSGAVELLLEQQRVSVRLLPDLSPDQQLELVRTLLAANLVTVSATAT